MSKKYVIIVLAIVLCLFAAQSAFAVDYPNVYKTLEIKEEYSLKEAFWFNPTIYSIDVLQFIQAYLMPDSAVDFYKTAADYTDEQIEEAFVIYQSFIEPEYVGYVNYADSCDVEVFAEKVGYQFDATSTYVFGNLFEELSDVAAIYPRGIGRANSYDTFRRSALQLAIYTSVNGKTPGFDTCYSFIQQAIAEYEKQFENAMTAESEVSEVQAEAEEVVSATEN
ncbi:MAG: hypothetical protein ACTTJW_08130 [Sphaerochaeta sp.]